MTGTDDILRTYNLTKFYSGRAAVDHVSMEVKKGEIYGLIGENGAGKTTLIRMIAALIHPDEGVIELFGEKGEKQPGRALSRVGIMVETPVMYPSLTAEQNLEYYRIQQGIPDRKCIKEALDLVGLTGATKKRFGHFSLGMKQRLGLALSILNNPDFIILDEPINGLDPPGIAEIRNTLKLLNENLGITILIASHILSELYLMATTYGILNHGRLIKELTKDQLDEQCRRCLAVTVDDIKISAVVLETVLGTTNYKVVNRNEIRLYDHLDSPAEVTYQLIAANVRVSYIHEIGTTLEDYYRTTIGETE